MSEKINPVSHIQGITCLLIDGMLNVTDIVEDMHRTIVHPTFLPSTPVQHWITNVSGLIYNNVRWSTKHIGVGLDKALSLVTTDREDQKISNRKEALRSVLNGVVGDYLEESNNPLAINMKFRHLGMSVDLSRENLQKLYPTSNGKLLILVHGSCMNDIQWRRKNHNHAEALASSLGMTPIYLHYNSGRHISTNGKDFSALLEKLIMQWPVPIEEIVVVAHSMGGLISRSAVYYGQQQKQKWATLLKKMVFLGTPHHGATLERAGSYLHKILQSVSYTIPIARLAKMRSAGVTDLRYGNLIDTDWEGADRFDISNDTRTHIPLPNSVKCYSIAGSLKSSSKSSKWMGDGLVDLNSALGRHQNPEKDLHFKRVNKWTAENCGHSDLLSNSSVYNKLNEWLA